jgi:hypothetical protein
LIFEKKKVDDHKLKKKGTEDEWEDQDLLGDEATLL